MTMTQINHLQQESKRIQQAEGVKVSFESSSSSTLFPLFNGIVRLVKWPKGTLHRQNDQWQAASLTPTTNEGAQRSVFVSGVLNRHCRGANTMLQRGFRL
jgi:hypothetical protein